MLNIQINEESDVPIWQQLTTQIEMAIALRDLKGADLMPSVRALGRRLNICHNTVSRAYSDLARAGLLVHRRGARMAVRGIDVPDRSRIVPDLDDLINEAMRAAGKAGYTPQDFRRHVLDRFSQDFPTRVLLVVAESRYGDLLRAELAEAIACPIQTCLMEELVADPCMAEGAVVVSHLTLMPHLLNLTGKRHAPVALQYSDTTGCLNRIKQLTRPSLIALVSVSPWVLASARLVFSSVAGDRHSITEYVLAEGASLNVGAADVILCDFLIYRGLATRDKKNVDLYRIVSKESTEQIQSLMDQRSPKRD